MYITNCLAYANLWRFFLLQSHYEERCRSLEEIVTSHCNRTTFEEFITQAFSPAPLDNLYNMADSRPASVAGQPSSVFFDPPRFKDVMRTLE